MKNKGLIFAGLLPGATMAVWLGWASMAQPTGVKPGVAAPPTGVHKTLLWDRQRVNRAGKGDRRPYAPPTYFGPYRGHGGSFTI